MELLKVEFKCQHCGRVYKRITTSDTDVDRRQHYCSDSCRQKAYRARKKAGLTRPIKPPGYIDIERYCEHCGQLMVVRSHNQRYCSTRCRQRAYRIRQGQNPRRRPGRPVNKS